MFRAIFRAISARTISLSSPQDQRKEAIVTTTIESSKAGRVRFQGWWWSARCNQNTTLRPDEKVVVVGRENITLLVEPIPIHGDRLEQAFLVGHSL